MSKFMPPLKQAGLFVGLCLFFLATKTAFANQSVLDGYWLQIHDTDGRPLSIIRVQTRGNVVSGQVQEVFLPQGAAEPICENCPGTRAGKPIKGMQIFSVSASEPKKWGGSIFDPISAREYKCMMELARDGKVLSVRGYVGVPTIGRTQLWRRYGSLR